MRLKSLLILVNFALALIFLKCYAGLFGKLLICASCKSLYIFNMYIFNFNNDNPFFLNNHFSFQFFINFCKLIFVRFPNCFLVTFFFNSSLQLVYPVFILCINFMFKYVKLEYRNRIMWQISRLNMCLCFQSRIVCAKHAMCILVVLNQ
jgi:hypothetical protein